MKKIAVCIAGLVIFMIAANLLINKENKTATGNEGKDVSVYEYLFKGESDNWRAEYHVDARQVFYEENNTLKGNSESHEVFKLIYKDSLDGLAKVKRIEWNFETVTGGGGGTRSFEEYPPDKKLFTQRSGGSGAIEPGNQEITVRVQWDGKTEEFTLKNTES